MQNSLDSAGPVRDYEDSVLDAGRKAVTAANQTYQAATKFLSYSGSDAGKDTVSRVDTINIAVASALKDTEPSIQSLATSISGAIPSSARQMAGLGTAANQSAAKAGTATQGLHPPSLRAAAAPTPGQVNAETVVRLTIAILARVNFITAQVGTGDVPVTTVREKMAQAINQSKPLTLAPDGDVTLNAGGQDVTIALSGGKPAYAAAFKGAAVPTGLTVSVTNASTSGILTLAATKGTTSTNRVPSFISDSTGMGKTINVTVK